MAEQFDIAIIGAGHNGLVCAAYLAKAGKRVVVLERAGQVGGAAITREFAPGFKVSAGAHILNGFDPKIIRDFNLEANGLELGRSALDTISLAENGNHLKIDQDGITGTDLTESDQRNFPNFIERMRAYAGALAPQLSKTPPRIAKVGFANAMQLAGFGWDIRFGLGKEKMRDFGRIVGMDIHGHLEDEFQSEALKAALAFDATLGTGLEPRMPGTVLTYLYRLAIGQNGTASIPKGGMGAVTQALAKAAAQAGADIRLNTGVREVRLEKRQAVGVSLESGDEISAGKIVSNADPKTTFLKLVGARKLEAGFVQRITHLRSSGRAAKIHIALNGVPEFTGLDPDALGGRLIVAPSRRYLEHAFNPTKYGELPGVPAMEITLPTASDPSLAPDGKHVLSAIVQHIPYEPSGGWLGQNELLVARILDTVSTYAPGLKGLVSHVECLTPTDIEQEFGMTGGHWHHSELTIDQMFMMRPTYGAAQYKTPVEGLYLCGAGAHPGGGVTGLPGRNAAQAILGRDA